MKNNIFAFATIGLALCLLGGFFWWVHYAGPHRVPQIEEGETLTLMVGQEMKMPFARGSETMVFAGKLPDSQCGRITSGGDVGLWVYLGRRFMMSGMTLLVEAVDEESITIRLVE